METIGGEQMENHAQKHFPMLRDSFDAVLMLTWSDWYTEMRSNRYHYASRFSRHLPVIFVQPDLLTNRFTFEATEIPQVTVLHIYRHYGPTQTKLIAQALNSRHITQPLVWIYNYLFDDFILKYHTPMRVYHATEDYFSTDFVETSSLDTTSRLRRVLRHTDLLISISQGIHEDYTTKGEYTGPSVVITNGCDYRYWVERMSGPQDLALKRKAKVALYQGGISRKIDFSLMQELAVKMPDWDFRLCGKVFISSPEILAQWQALTSLRNVTYLGCLKVDELKQQMHEATAGLIPFVRNDWIQERSFPLKTFEYLACGLPVISVPIKSLEPYLDLVSVAQTPEGFSQALIECHHTHSDPTIVVQRQSAAHNQDYDIKFREAVHHILQHLDAVGESSNIDAIQDTCRLNILILYDKDSTHVNTIREHLESFLIHSRHHIMYANATHNAICTIDLTIFDTIVIHYSVRLSLTSHLSQSYADHLKSYPGCKILFIQDEYDTTKISWDWIHSLGIHIVYTCFT